MTKKEKRMAFAPIPHLHGKTENLHDVQRTLANPEPFDQAAALFACLADNTRLRLFWLLCHREECVVNLSALLHMSSPAVSHHLRSLKDRGLVDSRRMGKEVHYRAAEGEVCRLLHRMVEQAMAVSCPREHTHTRAETARQAHDYLEEHMHEKCTIDQLARLFHVNATTLKTAFREVYGVSLAAHMKKHRLEAAEKMLMHTDKTLGEIAAAVGFASQSRFAEAFREKYGLLPSRYRRQKNEKMIRA